MSLEFLGSLQRSLGGQVPAVIGAVALLLAGWVIALIAAAASHKLLSAIGLNRRFESMAGQRMDAEKAVSRIVFWFVLLVALVAAFNSLELQTVSAPFANMISRVLGFLPQLLAGSVLALIGWIVALLVRAGLGRLLARTSLDEKLSAEAGMRPISESIGQVGYWVVLLLFLPMVLGALGLEGLLGPVSNLVDRLLAFLPNLVGAVVIGAVGYFVARIVRGIVVNLMDATRVQSAAQGLGVSDQMNLPKLAGTVVFLLIFVPALISALDALKIESISAPATGMLNELISALPNLLAAALILIVTWYVARFVSGVVASLAAGAGLDALPARFGVAEMLGQSRVSTVLGRLVVFFAMLFAAVEAANRLGFEEVGALVATFIEFGGDVLLGAVILMVGFWLANLISTTVGRGGSTWLAGLVRTLIVGLVIAMGLRAMGIADSIVNLAFGLTLGAVAVAVALSFGLGGRDAAGKLMEHWFSKLRKD